MRTPFIGHEKKRNTLFLCERVYKGFYLSQVSAFKGLLHLYIVCSCQSQPGSCLYAQSLKCLSWQSRNDVQGLLKGSVKKKIIILFVCLACWYALIKVCLNLESQIQVRFSVVLWEDCEGVKSENQSSHQNSRFLNTFLANTEDFYESNISLPWTNRSPLWGFTANLSCIERKLEITSMVFEFRISWFPLVGAVLLNIHDVRKALQHESRLPIL